MRNDLGVERDIGHHCDRSLAAATVLCCTDGLHRQQQTSRSAHELLIADPLALWTIGRKATEVETQLARRSVVTRVLGLAGAQHLIRKIVIVLRGEQGDDRARRQARSAGQVSCSKPTRPSRSAPPAAPADGPMPISRLSGRKQRSLWRSSRGFLVSFPMPMTLSQEPENRSRAHSQTEESSSTRAFPAQSNLDSGNC